MNKVFCFSPGHIPGTDIHRGDDDFPVAVVKKVRCYILVLKKLFLLKL